MNSKEAMLFSVSSRETRKGSNQKLKTTSIQEDATGKNPTVKKNTVNAFRQVSNAANFVNAKNAKILMRSRTTFKLIKSLKRSRLSVEILKSDNS